MTDLLLYKMKSAAWVAIGAERHCIQFRMAQYDTRQLSRKQLAEIGREMSDLFEARYRALINEKPPAPTGAGGNSTAGGRARARG